MLFLENKNAHLIKMDLVLIPSKEEYFQKWKLVLQMENYKYYVFIVVNYDTLLVGVMLCKNPKLLTMHGSQEGHWGLTPKDPRWFGYLKWNEPFCKYAFKQDL